MDLMGEGPAEELDIMTPRTGSFSEGPIHWPKGPREELWVGRRQLVDVRLRVVEAGPWDTARVPPAPLQAPLPGGGGDHTRHSWQDSASLQMLPSGG